MKRRVLCIMRFLAVAWMPAMSGCFLLDKGDPPDNPFQRPLELLPLFNSAERIKVPPFSYQDPVNGLFYRIRGDSSIIDIIAATEHGKDELVLLPFDTVSQMPTLRWTRTEKQLVYAAIFKKRIEGRSSRITNEKEIVWAWHSSLSSEKDLTYLKGRLVTDGKITDLPPVPLDKRGIYFWAAWAWDDRGVFIENSTAEQVFIVEE